MNNDSGWIIVQGRETKGMTRSMNERLGLV